MYLRFVALGALLVGGVSLGGCATAANPNESGSGGSATSSSASSTATTGTGGSAPAVCGNGVTEAGEDCDDGNTKPGDGCAAGCTLETGYACAGEPSVCTIPCG